MKHNGIFVLKNFFTAYITINDLSKNVFLIIILKGQIMVGVSNLKFNFRLGLSMVLRSVMKMNGQLKELNGQRCTSMQTTI